MGGKTATTTQQVTIPPEVMARYNAVNARAENVAQQPFQRYSNSPDAFVAPLNQTQQAGIANTNSAVGMANPFYQAATGLTLSGAKDVGPLTQGQIGYYQNPFTQAVVDPTLQALQQQQGQERNALLGKQAMSGAFGGDRAGLERANLTRQQDLATAQAIAPLYQQGYNTAVQTAAGQQGVVAQDLARRMQAGQAIGGLGAASQQAALQGAQAQLTAGQTQQQTEQAGKQALYNQFLQEQGYPFQVAQFLANIAMGTGALSGSTTTTEQPTGFFSDERLKHDAEAIGETYDGQPIYRYKYNGDDRTQIGLMAQDVENRHPHAVGLSSGFKTVDYEKATDDAAKRGGFYMGGAASEGGAVGLGNAGMGFALGGSAEFDQDMVRQLLSNQAGMYSNMYGQSGAPRGAQGSPGLAGGRVPSATLPVGKLATASGAPQPQQSGMSQAATTGRNIAELLQMGSKARDWITPKDSPKTSDVKQSDGTPANVGSATGYDRTAEAPTNSQRVADYVTEEPVQEFAKYGGKIVDDHPRLHRLYGGPTDTGAPQGIYAPVGMGLDIPDDKNKYDLLTAANAGKLDPSKGMKDLTSSVTTAKKMYDLGSKGKDFLSKLGDKPIEAGAEAVADAGKAAEGLGAAAKPALESTAAGLSGGTEAAGGAEAVGAGASGVGEAAGLGAAGEAAGLGAAGEAAGLGAAAGEAAGAGAAAGLGEAATAVAGEELLPMLFAFLLKDGGRANARKPFKDGGLSAASVDEEVAALGDTGLGSLFRPDASDAPEPPREGLRVAELKPTGVSPKDEVRASDVAPDFNTSVSRVFKEEGGLNRRDTNGAPSLYGINAKFHPEFFKNPSRERAAEIYRNDYWKPINADNLPAPLAHVAFDTAVIAGPKTAREMIERSGGDPNKLLDLRKQFQDTLIERDNRLPDGHPDKRNYAKYAGAWNNRINNLRNDVANMSEGKSLNLDERGPEATRVVTSNSVAAPGLGGAQRGSLDPYAAPFRDTFGKMMPEGTSEAFKSENFWVPMLAGIGSMLASNKFTLGQAVGEGLVGGVSAYTGLQKQQSDIAKTQADTEKVFTDIVDNSFKSINGIPHIRYRKPDGSYDWMPYGDWLNLDPKERPAIDPRVERVISTLQVQGVPAPGTPGAAKAVEEKVATATGTKPVETTPATAIAPEAKTGTTTPSSGPDGATPTTTAPTTGYRTVKIGPNGVPDRVGLTDEDIKAAQKAARDFTYAGDVERNKAVENDYFNAQQKVATAARQQMQQIVPLAGAFASLPKEKSIAASGRAQEFLQPIVGSLSNIAAMAGKPDLVINPEILTSQAEVDKLVNQLQQGRLDSSQLRAVEAFKAMAQGIPSLLNTPGAQAALMAQIMTNAKREIDKDQYFNDWKTSITEGKPGMKDYAALTSREANRAFDNRYSEAYYARDRKALENMFKDEIKGMKSPTSGGGMTVAEYLSRSGAKLTPAQKEKVVEKYGPSVLGYFGIPN